MKSLIAVALAGGLMLGGCASDPYVGYGGYYDGYRPYAYQAPSYSYGPSYGYPSYGYPSAGASFYFRDDDRDQWHRGRDRGRDDHVRDWRNRDRDDRGHDDRRRGSGRSDYREPLDTRHGEAGNEAGM